MEHQLQAFNFNNAQVRVIEKDGQPWFVLKDVCAALDLAHRAVKQRLLDDVGSTYPILDSLGRQQETTIINEDGLYDVILESRKPEAKAFRKWITSEVLPTIRQHGAYMTSDTIEKVLNDPDFLIGLATKLKEERQKNEALQLQNAQKEQIINELQPARLSIQRKQKSPTSDIRDVLIVHQIARWGKLDMETGRAGVANCHNHLSTGKYLRGVQ